MQTRAYHCRRAVGNLTYDEAIDGVDHELWFRVLDDEATADEAEGLQRQADDLFAEVQRILRHLQNVDGAPMVNGTRRCTGWTQMEIDRLKKLRLHLIYVQSVR